MTLTFDQSAYTDLLTQVTPKIIETEAEYEKTLAVVESLTFNQNKTAEQTALYKLLVLLVEAYEAEYYSMPEASPTEVLNHILEASDIKPVDLVGLIGSSRVVSEIISGSRAISNAEAKILSDRFRVSPSLFMQ